MMRPKCPVFVTLAVKDDGGAEKCAQTLSVTVCSALRTPVADVRVRLQGVVDACFAPPNAVCDVVQCGNATTFTLLRTLTPCAPSATVDVQGSVPTDGTGLPDEREPVVATVVDGRVLPNCNACRGGGSAAAAAEQSLVAMGCASVRSNTLMVPSRTVRGSITVTVYEDTDSSGTPSTGEGIAGARVLLQGFPCNADAPERVDDLVSIEIFTNVNGNATFVELLPGTYVFFVCAPSPTSLYVNISTGEAGKGFGSIVLNAGEVYNAPNDVVLRDGQKRRTDTLLNIGFYVAGSIHGVVRDCATPVEGLEVTLSGGDDIVTTTTTSPQGEFYFRGSNLLGATEPMTVPLLPGTYTVTVDGALPVEVTLASGEEAVAYDGQAALLPNDPRHESVNGALNIPLAATSNDVVAFSTLLTDDTSDTFSVDVFAADLRNPPATAPGVGAAYFVAKFDPRVLQLTEINVNIFSFSGNVMNVPPPMPQTGVSADIGGTANTPQQNDVVATLTFARLRLGTTRVCICPAMTPVTVHNVGMPVTFIEVSTDDIFYDSETSVGG